jgi:hypothetical protein
MSSDVLAAPGPQDAWSPLARIIAAVPGLTSTEPEDGQLVDYTYLLTFAEKAPTTTDPDVELQISGLPSEDLAASMNYFAGALGAAVEKD